MFENYDKCVSLYLSNMKRNCLSADSIDSYARTFRMFRESMETEGYTEACPAAVVAFKLSKTDLALTSLALYFTHLRLLAEFGVELGIFAENFVPDAIMPPKKKVAAERNKEYDHVLSEDQIIQLLTADKPNFGRKSCTWLREKAEVALLLQSGLRNSELRSLTLEDLDFEHGIIHARITKGDKPRCVSFPRTAQNAVREYLSSPLHPTWVKPSEPVFGLVDPKSGEWEGMGRVQLSARINYFTKAVLGEEYACRTHALRHGYSSVLLEHGVDIQQISESLGHSSVQTTTIYAKRLTAETPAQNIDSVFDRMEAV